MKSKLGICHLCGRETKLTFEHLPPKSANNKYKTKLITGKEIFNVEKLKRNESLRYISQQQGAGGYTLCQECNNNTGDWYAQEYIKFANSMTYILNNQDNIKNSKGIELYSDKMYYQRIFKQILCMFLSTIQPEFFEELQDIRDYVKDTSNNKFNKQKYRVGMYVLPEFENNHGGIMTLLLNENNKIIPRNIAIMNLYPLGFLLEIYPKEKEWDNVTNINSFSDYTYNQSASAKMILSITNQYSLHNFAERFMNKYRN